MVRGTGLLLLIPLLVGLGSAVSDLEPPKNLRIINEKEKLTVTWDWMNTSPDDVNVNFTVFYQELGMAPSEIPGCEHIEEYYCIIPSELPDITENYTLHVRVETHHGNKQSDSVSFQSMIEWPPIPSVDLMPQEFLVSVKLITPVHPSYANYHIVLQNMNSSTEEKIRPNLHSFEILYKDLKADAFYCLRAQIHDIQTRKLSPFSEARCFTALKGLPENLRVEGVNTIYLLKWDWDYEKYPDVTFSVKRSYSSQSNWSIQEGCENITTLECNVSNIESFLRRKFLVSVYNKQTDERYSNIVTFLPVAETVMGPPTNLQLEIQNNNLYITVRPPEGFKELHLHQSCMWMYHLESWKNSTPSEVKTMNASGPHFFINDVEASTIYCAKAYTKCNMSNRTGLYSDVYCFKTAPRSYMKELIIGSVFVGIVVISIILYFCLCPLKRYLKQIFFPKSKLPSSIEKGLPELPQNYIKNFFLLREEETTDKCYIMQSSPVDAEDTIDKNTSDAKGRDSGNYSNEDEVTGSSSNATL